MNVFDSIAVFAIIVNVMVACANLTRDQKVQALPILILVNIIALFALMFIR